MSPRHHFNPTPTWPISNSTSYDLVPRSKMALHAFPQTVPRWTATAIPAPAVSFMHVPASVPMVHPPPPVVPALKGVNDISLTRKLLKQALSDLSETLYRCFLRQVHLIVHGGAVMVLHSLFFHRESTQDVDYIHQSFVS